MSIAVAVRFLDLFVRLIPYDKHVNGTAYNHAMATFLFLPFSIRIVLLYPRLDSPSGVTAANGQMPRFSHVSMVMHDKAYF